jgi:small subunit ribosomal protein S6
MKDYELMYIVPTSYTEEELGTVEKNVAQIFEKNGATISKTTRLGKFRFTYPIKREQHGHYVLVRFQAESSALHGINEGLRMNQKEVLRHIIVDGSDVSENFKLVQFQEVTVESTDQRRRRIQKEEKDESEEAEKSQKEGVAALEDGAKKEEVAEEPKESIETLSEEDLQKKIDAALTEEAE